MFWKGFVKKALDMGTAGGIYGGYQSGSSTAETAAKMFGGKKKDTDLAKNIAKATTVLGTIGGLVTGFKHRDKLVGLAKKYISSHPEMVNTYDTAIPFVYGSLGGAGAGAATGAATTLLRKKFKKSGQ